jgi:hypothetical protein
MFGRRKVASSLRDAARVSTQARPTRLATPDAATGAVAARLASAGRPSVRGQRTFTFEGAVVMAPIRPAER